MRDLFKTNRIQVSLLVVQIIAEIVCFILFFIYGSGVIFKNLAGILLLILAALPLAAVVGDRFDK